MANSVKRPGYRKGKVVDGVSNAQQIQETPSHSVSAIHPAVRRGIIGVPRAFQRVGSAPAGADVERIEE